MKRLLIASALMMAVSGVASADDRWDDRREGDKARYEAQREAEKDRQEAWREAEKDRREAWREAEKDRREAAKDRREAEREYWKDRNEAAREFEKDRREAMREQDRAGRRWARGEHLPRLYLAEPYYVRDYDAYDLAPPPRGYAWVRPDPRDDEYYLVQLATGLIAQFLDR